MNEYTRLMLLPEIDCHQPILFHGKTKNRLSVYKIEWVSRKALWMNHVVLDVTCCMFHAYTIDILWFLCLWRVTLQLAPILVSSRGDKFYDEIFSAKDRVQICTPSCPCPPSPSCRKTRLMILWISAGFQWLGIFLSGPSCMTGNP